MMSLRYTTYRRSCAIATIQRPIATSTGCNATTITTTKPFYQSKRFRARTLTTSTKESVVQQQASQQTQAQADEQSVSWIRRSWRNGNILLGIGYTGLALFGIDLYLQYVQNIEKRNSYQLMVTIQEETARKRRELYETYVNYPTIFQCIVRTEYKNMGGTHGLQNIQLNDIVDILEENVGPDGYYDLCRVYESDGTTVKSIGWYPKQYLQKIESSPVTTNGFWRKFLIWKKIE